MKSFMAMTSLLMLFSKASATGQEAAQLLPEQFTFGGAPSDAEQEFVVKAAPAISQPCLAVASMDKDIDIVVSTELLQNLAATAQQDGYQNETERLALIAARRAQALLQSATNAPTVQGCMTARVDAETQYLIGRLLNSGQVAVLNTRTGQVYPSFTVAMSSAKGIGGMAAYRIPDDGGKRRTFFSYQTWVR